MQLDFSAGRRFVVTTQRGRNEKILSTPPFRTGSPLFKMLQRDMSTQLFSPKSKILLTSAFFSPHTPGLKLTLIHGRTSRAKDVFLNVC